jgi:hypothetical protein
MDAEQRKQPSTPWTYRGGVGNGRRLSRACGNRRATPMTTAAS